MNVEKISQIIIFKPDGEAILIIKDKGIIQSVNFTRTSVIDVWYEVVSAEILKLGTSQDKERMNFIIPDIVLLVTKYSIFNILK